MPTSLLVAIIVLSLLALVTAYLGAREKFPQMRSVAVRILGR
jgi:hypothetical protein